MDKEPVSFVLGELKADVKTLQTEVRQIRMDVTVIRSKWDEQKGGWKMLTLLLATAGGIGAGVVEIIRGWR